MKTEFKKGDKAIFTPKNGKGYGLYKNITLRNKQVINGIVHFNAEEDVQINWYPVTLIKRCE